eukprot:10959110-Lingulodinium_polyedra.AAC.1
MDGRGRGGRQRNALPNRAQRAPGQEALPGRALPLAHVRPGARRRGRHGAPAGAGAGRHAPGGALIGPAP